MKKWPCRRFYFTANTRHRTGNNALIEPSRRIMAIALEFIDVVIPIARIREAYPGGWEQCVLDYEALLGRRIWYDRHLFRDGAINPAEAKILVEGWAVLGFEPTGSRGAGLYWKDICVVEWCQGGPTLPCDWLCFDRSSRTAHLAGAVPGALAWRGEPNAHGDWR
jgi:hypothetical protein